MTSNVIQSKYPTIQTPLVTVSRFLIEKLRFYGNKTFLIENETKISYTFNEVADDSLRMAHVLYNNGLTDGQNFGICGHNNYEYVITLFGGLIVGGVAVPLDKNCSIDRIQKSIKEKNIKCLTVVTRNQNSLSKEAFNKLNKGLKTIVSFNDHLYDKSSEELSDESVAYECHRKPIRGHERHNESHIGVIKPVNPKERTCLVIDTNGSFDVTKSKTCLISDYSLLSQITVSSLPVTGFNWTASDTVLNTTSFAHINGLLQLFCALASGSQFVLFDDNYQTNLKKLYKAIEEWSVSAAMLTPRVIIGMIKDEQLDVSMAHSLAKVICTGASMPKNVSRKFIDKLNIKDFRQAYGMTELCGFATIEPIGSTDVDTSGVPVPGVSIKIVDPDTNAVLGPTQVGEIYVRSERLFKGYLNSDLNSGKQCLNGVDSEGWFATKDIGYYDNNRKLQIVDPNDDFILTRGLHISPTSLEAILLSHFAVREVTLFGTSRGQHEQSLTALVVLKANINNNNDYSDSSEQQLSQMLRNFINDHLVQQNLTVDSVHIVDDIPKTISGKVNRNDLRLFVSQTIGELNKCETIEKYLIDL